tara:strand:- start:329 stop:907 length:579 start_codon:yes stop_codon:yes gene_type:complete
MLFVDGGNDRVGIGVADPDCTLEIAGTDAIHLPSGTNAQRPTAANGMMRYSTTNSKFEVYQGGGWVTLDTSSAPVYRYARYRVSTGATHHPRASRLHVIDSNDNKYTVQTYTSDNCDDSGGIPANTATFTYDLGSGNSATWTGIGFYSTYEGGLRSTTVYLDQSTDNSTWVTVGSATALADSECGELNFTVS